MSPLRPRKLTQFVDPKHPSLTITRQAALLGLDRQAYYYRPIVNEAELSRLKVHMDAVDEIYTARPYYGTRRMQYELEKAYGICIGRGTNPAHHAVFGARGYLPQTGYF